MVVAERDSYLSMNSLTMICYCATLGYSNVLPMCTKHSFFKDVFPHPAVEEGASMSFQKEKIFCLFAEFFSQWNFLIIP